MQTKSSGHSMLSWSVTGREGTRDPPFLALGPGSIGVVDPSASGSTEGRALPVSATVRVSGSPDPSMYSYGLDGQAIEPAVQYVQKIKQRCDAETYKQFLEILSRYHQQPDMNDEVRFAIDITRVAYVLTCLFSLEERSASSDIPFVQR